MADDQEQQAEAPARGMGDNSGAALAEYAATIKARVADAEASEKASAALVVETSRETLGKLREAGQALNDAKTMLTGQGKGAFGHWCDGAGFTFDKSYRAKLMKVAENWDAIVVAVEAMPEDKRSWGINKALVTWRATLPRRASPWRQNHMYKADYAREFQAQSEKLAAAKSKLEARDRQVAKLREQNTKLREMLKAKGGTVPLETDGAPDVVEAA